MCPTQTVSSAIPNVGFIDVPDNHELDGGPGILAKGEDRGRYRQSSHAKTAAVATKGVGSMGVRAKWRRMRRVQCGGSSGHGRLFMFLMDS